MQRSEGLLPRQTKEWRFSDLPTTARSIWAKSGTVVGHGLLAHMLDVAAVAETILEREPQTSLHWGCNALGFGDAHGLRWIAAAAGLHDFGKAIPGFQSKWVEGAEADRDAGLEFSQRSCQVTRHDCATAALLGDLLKQRSGAERDWVRHVLQAISAHHGYHFLQREIDKAKPYREAAAWSAARAALLESFWGVLSPVGKPELTELDTPAVNWLAGLTSVADWIASNPEWFPLGERHDDLDKYFADAKTRADAALDSINWPRHHVLQDSAGEDTNSLMGRIVGAGSPLSARPLQETGDRLLATARGPTLLLVEAPMGEGKTELAFIAHLRLQAINRHRGLYLALPTQATSNALFQRALTFLRGFAHDEALDVQLVHGGAAMNEQVRHLREIDHSDSESVSASVWFSQRRRPLLSPYGVGTVDQALFATLNVRHHFVRLWGLSNRVIVLDEVHAYDTYTTGLIEALLRWLKFLGSSVVLMSATLPKARRDDLLRAWGARQEAIPVLPYPRLMLADAEGVRGASFASRVMAPIQMSGIGEDLDSIVETALERIAHGGCGAVIVNTVDRAQELYRRLKEQCGAEGALLLFHARFPADERSVLEKEVLRCFGPNGERPLTALMIATQVAEQSLDLDFDFMLTDLAPVDLVLQRAGRLHRHVLRRPKAHATARLFVAGLRADRLPDLKKTAWEFIYDPYILGRTWAFLSRESTLELPQDIDRLVQAVYDGNVPLPDDLEDGERTFIEGDFFGKHCALVQNQRTQSYNVAINPRVEPHNAYTDKPRGKEENDGLGLVNRTRLGDDPVVLVLVHVEPDGWRVKPGDTPFSPCEIPGDDLARRLYGRQIRVSNKAVVKHFQGIEAPHAFASHPLLRDFKALTMQGERYKVSDQLTLELDRELGLVYRRESTS